jgi:hypothetical protein
VKRYTGAAYWIVTNVTASKKHVVASKADRKNGRYKNK